MREILDRWKVMIPPSEKCIYIYVTAHYFENENGMLCFFNWDADCETACVATFKEWICVKLDDPVKDSE